MFFVAYFINLFHAACTLEKPIRRIKHHSITLSDILVGMNHTRRDDQHGRITLPRLKNHFLAMRYRIRSAIPEIYLKIRGALKTKLPSFDQIKKMAEEGKVWDGAVPAQSDVAK